jgi:hypothetical protein
MADRHQHKHGRTKFFIEGEGVVDESLPSPRLRGLVPAAISPAPGSTDTTRAFRFCRLFSDLAHFAPDDAGLIALGQALVDPFTPGSGDSEIPAGFTYLGQFVDHDMTFDRTEGIPDGSLDPAEIEQGRSPALELDSVYGRGPIGSPELYEPDKTHLRVGTTTGRPLFGVTDPFPNDLPRKAPGDLAASKQAIIGDPRNDENLLVAQTHLAFLAFHNKVVDRLAAGTTAPKDLFGDARKTVIQHYQSIVLHDFLPRLVNPAVLQDVLQNGRRWYFPDGAPSGTYLCMPVEFSVAAYRLGHSMIRGAYQWNRVFSSTGLAGFVPQLTLFFEFSALSGDLGGSPTLPSDWIVDWRRLYDFSESGETAHPQLNFTRQIDTMLANALQNLPEFANAEQQHLKFLAARNLLRGRLVGLPTGQDVAAKLGVTPLTPAEVASGAHAALIQAQAFDVKTPLWFYILKEAEVRHAGQHLGDVGSRLVVETFHGLVEGSDFSILKESAWKPLLPSHDPNRFTMNDLLRFVDDLNPLGD